MRRLSLALIALVVNLWPAMTITAQTGPQPTSTPVITGSGLVAPGSLTQMVGGKAVAAGGWINQPSIQLRLTVTGGSLPIRPEIELRPMNQELIGEPTSHGATVNPGPGRSQTVSLTVGGLQPATGYQWQARIVDIGDLASSWVPFPVSGTNVRAFSVDTRPPTPSTITSSTNPRSGWWYNTRVERFTWRSVDMDSGVDGYSIRVDHAIGGKPGVLTRQTSRTLINLADGKWVLHVWARDRAGNWNAGSMYKLNLDTTPPGIKFVDTSSHDFNPYLGSITWRYTTDQRAHLVVDIRRSGQKSPVLVKDLGTLKPGTQAYTWDGKTATGALASAGWYWFHVTATDGVGNSSNRAFGGIHVTPVAPAYKRIVISLGQQTIAAYQNGRLVYSSLATTGNFSLAPTPAGHYHIFARYSPYLFVSPWPPGDPLWYESEWSTYAMEFISGGYFIHDAPWRNVFGPASQGGGRPGTDYGGTHGCVNVPPATAAFLWGWAPMGTDVDVVA